MLRWWVLALLTANLMFFAWSRGQAGRTDSEPTRQIPQVHPEAVRLLTPGKAAAASAPQAASGVEATASAAETAASQPVAARCIEAGPFNATEVATAEAALVASPAASGLKQRWSRVSDTVAPVSPNAESAVYHLRVDAATPDEATVLESLPSGLLTHGFVPCAPR